MNPHDHLAYSEGSIEPNDGLYSSFTCQSGGADNESVNHLRNSNNFYQAGGGDNEPMDHFRNSSSPYQAGVPPSFAQSSPPESLFVNVASAPSDERGDWYETQDDRRRSNHDVYGSSSARNGTFRTGEHSVNHAAPGLDSLQRDELGLSGSAAQINSIGHEYLAELNFLVPPSTSPPLPAHVGGVDMEYSEEYSAGGCPGVCEVQCKALPMEPAVQAGAISDIDPWTAEALLNQEGSNPVPGEICSTPAYSPHDELFSPEPPSSGQIPSYATNQADMGGITMMEKIPDLANNYQGKDRHMLDRYLQTPSRHPLPPRPEQHMEDVVPRIPQSFLQTTPWATVGDRESNRSTPVGRVVCGECHAEFTGEYGKGNCGRHMRLKHAPQGEQQYPCEESSCPKTFKRKDALLKHVRREHPEFDTKAAVPRKLGNDHN